MSDAVRQIKEKLNILDVISPYVELHKAGKNFKGKSPFSAEKTPSFYVSPDRGMYYCFSTSQGGDVFNFIQAIEGVDFKEALKILADKAGVELVPENPEKRSERERLYAALEAATEFYQSALAHEPAAKEYLTTRGVTDHTVSKWRIGYAPGPPRHGWRETKEHLTAAGYTAQELLKAGLIKTTDSGKDPFDVFRDRIVFPMAESGGKVVAFSGRILSVDTEAPKYVNSPETELYKKSELLFGYDKAKQSIRHLDFSLIVEGQFDVIMCHQAGYTNTVAVSGTALTLAHVQQLERMSDKVVLALDADRAGISAMKRGAELMLARGLDVKVAELPLGEDPADLILRDVAQFKAVIKKSVHVIEFLLHVLRREITDDRSYKLKARTEVLPFVLQLPSRIDQEHFVGKIAAAIGTTTEAVRFELDRLREQSAVSSQRQSNAAITEVLSPDSETSAPTEGPQNAHLFLLAATPLLEETLAKRVEKELAELSTWAPLPVPDDTAALAGTVFTLEQQFAEWPVRAVVEEVVAKLNQLKTRLVRQQLSELRQELQAAEAIDNTDEITAILTRIQQYETMLREPAYEVDSFLGSKDKD